MSDRCVDLVCSDPWVANSGDVATALATANGLAELGIPVRRVAVPDDHSPLTIIGGGHLFHSTSASWNDRLIGVSGPCIINAAGADPGGAIDWPRHVIAASFRDAESAELYQSDHPNVPVRLTPCPAVLLSPLPWNEVCSLPRWSPLSRFGERGYIVVHARHELAGVANGATQPVIAMEPAPYTMIRWEAIGWLLPWTHSPELLLSVISRAEAVVTISLHMGILALAAGVPFAVLDLGTRQTDKCRRYWQRAGFEEVIYRGNRPVAHALGIAGRLAEVRERERGLARSQLRWIADVTRAFLGDDR